MALDYSDEKITFSLRFKRKMNRLFREELRTDSIPHPEADNLWERFRSKLVCFLHNRL